MATVSKGWTYTMNGGSFSVVAALGLTVLSIYAKTGTVTITGSLQAGGGYASTPVVLKQGEFRTLCSAGNTSTILDGYTIQSGGETLLIGG